MKKLFASLVALVSCLMSCSSEFNMKNNIDNELLYGEIGKTYISNMERDNNCRAVNNIKSLEDFDVDDIECVNNFLLAEVNLSNNLVNCISKLNNYLLVDFASIVDLKNQVEIIKKNNLVNLTDQEKLYLEIYTDILIADICYRSDGSKSRGLFKGGFKSVLKIAVSAAASAVAGAVVGYVVSAGNIGVAVGAAISSGLAAGYAAYISDEIILKAGASL